MTHRARRHTRVVAFTHSVVVFTLLASSAVTFERGETVLYLAPRTETELSLGDSTEIDIMLSTETPINAISATVAFPTELIDIVGISKERSFLDLWTEETAIREDVGEIHFSGGTVRKGGIIGTTTALTIAVRAKRPGIAELYFREARVLASDGRGTTVESTGRPFSYRISPPALANAGGGTSVSSPEAQPSNRSPDLNADGAVNLVDISIFLMGLATTRDMRLDLNSDGAVSVGDLSVLLVHMR